MNALLLLFTSLLMLKPSTGKRHKESCTLNISTIYFFDEQSFRIKTILCTAAFFITNKSS